MTRLPRWHSFAHHWLEQSGPPYPVQHWHLPLTHLPRHVQSPGHCGSSHATPTHPFAHVHLAVARSHVPCPEQSFGQLPHWHASP